MGMLGGEKEYFIWSKKAPRPNNSSLRGEYGGNSE